MAVGGVALPVLYPPTVCGEDTEDIKQNLEEQNDEIVALQSIFEAEEDRITVLSMASPGSNDSVNAIQILIPVASHGSRIRVDVVLPLQDNCDVEQMAGKNGTPKSGVTLARSESGQRLLWSFDCQYLSSLYMNVTLPPTYPSQDPPVFSLSCLWLSPNQLTALCRELDRLWEENQGMPVLYTWIDWLQENVLSHLGIEDSICVSTHELDEEFGDPRATILSTDINEIVTTMVRFDRQQARQEFFKDSHECEVCLEEYLGTKFFWISECQHHVCRECMKESCQLHVREGTVLELGCPIYECKSSIPPFMMKEVLTEEEYTRYEKLSLEKGLGVMGDIVWCPRCVSPVIKEPEKDLKLAHCTNCWFTFCTECLEKSHQGEICRTDEEKLKAKKEELEKKKAVSPEEEEERRIKLQQLKEEHSSMKLIKEKAKHCPNCNAPIMKVSGCNNVHCTRCGQGMCWVCGSAIDGYTHFADNPKCNTFTFDQLDMDDFGQNMNMQNGYIQRLRPFAQIRRAERRLHERIVEMKAAARDPEQAQRIRNCPGCKQRNMKEGNNNHLRCWNCHTSFCFMCKQKIRGSLGDHYKAGSPCNQHS